MCKVLIFLNISITTMIKRMYFCNNVFFVNWWICEEIVYNVYASFHLFLCVPKQNWKMCTPSTHRKKRPFSCYIYMLPCLPIHPIMLTIMKSRIFKYVWSFKLKKVFKNNENRFVTKKRLKITTKKATLC